MAIEYNWINSVWGAELTPPMVSQECELLRKHWFKNHGNSRLATAHEQNKQYFRVIQLRWEWWEQDQPDYFLSIKTTMWVVTT
jgi:hypothetical protein